MPKPYSYDLRQKVIQAIELDGMKKSEAAQVFQISRNTINLWLQRIDEAGMDNREDYGYGWNEKGQRFHALKSGRRQGRVNMIAACCNGKLFAPFTVEGACNRTVFETWLETCLIPSLKPGQIVIADNATFHRGGRIQELIESAGCHLKYLPSYSPELNKIEQCWSWLKSRIRKQLIQFDCLRNAMEDVLRTAS